jgi:hypothetical protein
MRAVGLRGGRLEVRATADPVPADGELLLRTLARSAHGSPRIVVHPNGAAEP